MQAKLDLLGTLNGASAMTANEYSSEADNGARSILFGGRRRVSWAFRRVEEVWHYVKATLDDRCIHGQHDTRNYCVSKNYSDIWVSGRWTT
jgi:hypothetical protein